MIPQFLEWERVLDAFLFRKHRGRFLFLLLLATAAYPGRRSIVLLAVLLLTALAAVLTARQRLATCRECGRRIHLIRRVHITVAVIVVRMLLSAGRGGAGTIVAVAVAWREEMLIRRER